MNCSPASLVAASRCYCLPANASRGAWLWLLWQWANAQSAPVTGAPILSNGSGGFCQLMVDITGNVGTQTSGGPATSPVPVIADGGGGFWQIVTDAVCNRGTTSVPGPATAPVVLIDANLVNWTLTVDNTGNLGATS